MGTSCLNKNEVWKPVVGRETFYDVSNRGRVRTSFEAKKYHFRFRGGRILKQHIICRYLKVALCGLPRKQFRTVHTLVLEAFVGPRPRGCVSRHLDGNALNNNDSNLAWGTQKENMSDKNIHGTNNAGSRHGNSKLTESDIATILKRRAEGLPCTKIAKNFPVNYRTIWAIVTGQTWRHVTRV